MHNHLTKNAAAERSLHDHHMNAANFDLAPFTIAWEVTRACAYACVHCRADAQHQADPHELNTRESLKLIDRPDCVRHPKRVALLPDPHRHCPAHSSEISLRQGSWHPPYRLESGCALGRSA
jgi:hypothetical protein